MKLHVINTGYFKLDGGAMFGVVPKSLWSRFIPADEKNLCTWSMRCLLIEDGDQLILIDNGIGDKQDEHFFKHYYLHGDDSLEKSLKTAGFSPDDITDMFLTHLHFDHCGGGVKKGPEDNFRLTFPNATYWSNVEHWLWATQPNPREKASFLRENIMPMEELGQLKFIDINEPGQFEQFDIHFVDGHTDKQMLPKIKYKNKTIVFVADLFPSAAHIPIPYVMAYDTRPMQTMTEKAEFLNEAMENDYILFFEHDAQFECCNLKKTERGIRADETFNLKDIL